MNNRTYQLPEQAAQAKDMLDRMIQSEGEYTVKYYKGHTRSDDQVALWWVWMGKIAEFVKAKGYGSFTKEQVSHTMKHEFNFYEPKFSDKVPAPIKSLSRKGKAAKAELFDLMCQVDAYWAGKGLLLEKPEESEFWKYWQENR